ncbi:ETS-related transcription factor Elf-4-like isoform X2 [Acropora muricata]
MLKKWLSSYSYPSTSAAPIAATTITLEGIQSVIHAWGFPIEAPADVDPYLGPFEDTQFDAVVDVETSPDDSPDSDFKFTDLDACSEYGYCSSDVPDDEMDFFKLDDLTAYSSPALFSDPGELDFGFDSGIEAEMDEPNDGSENGEVEKEKSKRSEERENAQDSGKEEGVSQGKNTSSPPRKVTEPEDKRKRQTTEENDDKESDDEDDTDDDGAENSQDNDDDLPQFHCHYLWEFLHHILLDKENKYIEWKNKTRGVFRLKDHNGLARLWGKQKNRKNMTYEKLSRALRYYYSKDILQKVPGQRLTYKFVHNLDGKKYPL